MKFGFLTDLSTYQFDEETPSQWIQAFPLGSWNHPLHGEIDITPNKISRMASHIRDGIRGQDLDIDYDHKADPAKGSKAAGWIQDAEVREDGLYVSVRWTPSAKEAIKNGEYRYFSPEYTDEWSDPRGGKYQDVLFGGALTNRPFLKGIMPINMSEHFSEEESQVEEFLKALREKLGLAEDATEEEILAAASFQDPEPTPEETENEEDAEEALVADLVLASEEPVAVRQLTDLVKKQGEMITSLQKSNRDKDVTVKLNEWTTATDAAYQFALPPALHGDLRKIMLNEGGSIESFIESLLKTGLVELGERGAIRSNGETVDATKRFGDAVSKLQAAGSMDYADAVTRVASDDPELFEAYRQEALGEVK